MNINYSETEIERAEKRSFENKFRKRGLFCFGLLNASLLVGGVFLLPIVPPIGITLIICSSVMLLGIAIALPEYFEFHERYI